VCLDVVELGRRLERVVFPVQVFHPPVNIRITAADSAEVAFEVTMIHWVKPNDGSEESSICLCELVAYEVLFPL